MQQTDLQEKIILGIDPGTQVMGYGILSIRVDHKKHKQIELLQYGVIRLTKYKQHELKLKKIFERVLGLINEYSPDEVALEAPFYGKNVQSMLKLGRAQGVAMAAALSCQIPIVEYAPKKVKQSVTGNGNASKEQVAHMLQSLLKFPEQPSAEQQLLDATDALAVALCHHYQKATPVRQAKSWKAFVADNPERVKG
ncbi:crossover junction endodeoxyribonuclease RuvC [Catalinimonas alkaloidigena]|uniref:crossover junction endodeoxyribonuclease RuvC n=1 Tax=Catalinimonas alkaloidigena TaxID=1075417 RepID=UPI002406BDCA|nr:crossover junction endodeoxyribonuclease RuvC [Catalinimonas alkaloidigena]MDF9799818.1 crossover junction endodeoxyribonuclease RuvC [Catalinimonas alkaloidigena]